MTHEVTSEAEALLLYFWRFIDSEFFGFGDLSNKDVPRKERDVGDGSWWNIAQNLGSLGNFPQNLKYKFIKTLYISDK